MRGEGKQRNPQANSKRNVKKCNKTQNRGTPTDNSPGSLDPLPLRRGLVYPVRLGQVRKAIKRSIIGTPRLFMSIFQNSKKLQHYLEEVPRKC
jgi:hypothetical protein